MICVGSTVGCFRCLHLKKSLATTHRRHIAIFTSPLFHARYDSTHKCIAATATVPCKFHTTTAECDINNRKADAI